MSELKAGQEVWVSNESIEGCTQRTTEYLFVGMLSNGQFGVEYGGDLVSYYRYAIPVPQPKEVDYSFDTFPRGIVYIAPANHVEYLIIGITFEGVHVVNKFISWSDLNECGYEISTDVCITWQKAVNHD